MRYIDHGGKDTVSMWVAPKRWVLICVLVVGVFVVTFSRVAAVSGADGIGDVQDPEVGQLCSHANQQKFKERLGEVTDGRGYTQGDIEDLTNRVAEGCDTIAPEDIGVMRDRFFEEGVSRSEQMVRQGRERFGIVRPWEYGRSVYEQAKLMENESTGRAVDERIADLASALNGWGWDFTAAYITSMLDGHLTSADGGLDGIINQPAGQQGSIGVGPRCPWSAGSYC